MSTNQEKIVDGRKDRRTIDSIQSEEATLIVSRTRFGQTTEATEKIRVRPFVTNPAIVTVGASRTVNLGNYESARFEVRLSVPCYVEEMVSTYRDTVELVEKLLDGEVNKIVTASSTDI